MGAYPAAHRRSSPTFPLSRMFVNMRDHLSQRRHIIRPLRQRYHDGAVCIISGGQIIGEGH